jgi:hypothetical protein
MVKTSGTENTFVLRKQLVLMKIDEVKDGFQMTININGGYQSWDNRKILTYRLSRFN